MNGLLEEYFVQWITSNVVALALLFMCWKHPKLGRFGFAIVFLVASGVNVMTVLNGPHVYLEYRHFALFNFYRSFITGFFAEHIQLIVLLIAGGQLLISAGLFVGKNLMKPALVAGIIFALAIAPLGIGSGMPVPLLMATSMWLLYTGRSSREPRSIVT